MVNAEPDAALYKATPQPERRLYVQAHVWDQTDLPESFLLTAVSWEQDAVAKWYLIKGLGILHSKEAVEPLVTVCESPDVDFHNTSLHAISAWALGRIGEPAANRILMLLANREPYTRKCAVDALGEIGAPAFVDMLVTALRTDVDEVQLWAGLSLAKLGATSVAAIDQLLIEVSDQRTRLIAIDALLKIGHASRLALKRLLRCATVEEQIFILGSSYPFSVEFIDELKILCNSTNSEVSSLAVQILKELQSSN